MCNRTNLVECFHMFVDIDLLNVYTAAATNLYEINFKIL